MKENRKKQIGLWIYKTIGTPSFIRRIEWRSIIEWVDPKEGERILDVACGMGAWDLKLAKERCKVCGVDRSEDEIKNAKRLAEMRGLPCDFVIGSAEDLPYRENYFDKVVCSSSLEHFKNDVKALEEMHRVLKSNGTVVLTTDSLTYPISDELKEKHRKNSYIMNYYTKEKLKERLDVGGFKMTRSEYLLNSRVTSFFFKHIYIKKKIPGFLLMAISFFVFPLCLLSDRLFGERDIGYTLIAEGWKVK
jgi:ubiquinone/menaquinone biosynthesis C-methylase UbiE